MYYLLQILAAVLIATVYFIYCIVAFLWRFKASDVMDYWGFVGLIVYILNEDMYLNDLKKFDVNDKGVMRKSTIQERLDRYYAEKTLSNDGEEE